jgi:putative metalloprotease
MKNAYYNAAARQAVGAVGTVGAALSDSVLGDLAETYLGARYSQQQENQADDYGFQFTVDSERDPYAMMRSMQTLQSLSGGSTATSGLMQAFSSHPDTAAREKRMREKAEAYLATQE